MYLDKEPTRVPFSYFQWPITKRLYVISFSLPIYLDMIYYVHHQS